MSWSINTRGDLGDYLEVGDEVDEAMVEYFIGVLPPATYTSELVQIGEPYSHVNGRPTYPTLHCWGGDWFYAGNCHKGTKEDPE